MHVSNCYFSSPDEYYIVRMEINFKQELSVQIIHTAN